MAKIKPKLSKKPKSQKSDWEIIDLPQAQLGKIQNPYKSGVSFPTEGTAVSKVYDPKGSVSNPIMLPEFTVEEKPSLGTQTTRWLKNQPATGAAESVPFFETLLLPASLPIQATSRLGKAATLAAEVLNPVGGFRGFKKGNNNFTSEIDWGKWNPETPKYPELINEYNAIEESTKKAGTWMKNPDGSAFQGTPEQFIQQQSSWFNKSFPNILKDKAGNIQRTYHGSQNTFDYFDPNIMMTGRTRGQGIYTSPFRERAASYATKGDKKVYEFYQNANKPQDIVQQFNKASEQRFKEFLEKNPKGSKDFNKKFDEFMKKEDELYNLTDDDFNLQKGYDFLKVSPDEYVVPFSNFPKSAVGNVGFFDMTNPNIYKSVAPFIGLGAAAMQQSQPQEQKNGGTISNWEIIPEAQSGRVIEDNMGQWKYPGEITKINSPNITMQEVNYPVLGVSDTNDVQMMYPNQDYKFKGSSVTEYPVMQPGGRVPIYVNNPNDPRLRAYNDSLNLYNNSERRLREFRRFGDANNLLYVNPNPSSSYLPFEHPTIAPIDRTGFVYNFDTNNPNGEVRMVQRDGSLNRNLYQEASTLQRRLSGSPSAIIPIYKKPVQPVIYQPIRKKEQPINIQSKTPNLLQSSPINQELNLIPFAKGTYYRRPRQSQEIGQNIGQFPGRVTGLTDLYQKGSGIRMGTIDNEGHIVDIVEGFAEGGELPEAGSGYKVIRSSERKGKTHKVIGPDGTVKFFGDSKLGQHPKDPARKKAFYARHKKNLAKNPYFRAFARKTWEEGGELNDWEILDTAQDGLKTNKDVTYYGGILPEIEVKLRPNVSGCVAGMCHEMSDDAKKPLDVFRHRNNLYGDAWQILNNAYGENINLNNENYSNLKVNDIVNLTRDELPSDKEKGIPLTNQHVGYVSKIVDGVPYVNHFINHRYYEEPINNINAVFKYKPTKAKRLSDYQDLDIQPSSFKFDEGYQPNQIENEFLNASFKKPELQKILSLNSKDYDNLEKLAYGIMYNESKFGRSGKTLYRMAVPDFIQKAVKVANDVKRGVNVYDENINNLSQGYSSTKESTLHGVNKTDKNDKRTPEQVNKDIKEGDYSNLERTNNYLYYVLGEMGITPDNLENGENSYKAIMANLSWLKKRFPNATNEELIKRYTGKKNITNYKKSINKAQKNIDQNSKNNLNYTKEEEIYGNLSHFANKINSGLKNASSETIGLLRDLSPAPITINALVGDILGSKKEITEKSLSPITLNKLKEIVKAQVEKGKYNLDYNSYFPELSREERLALSGGDKSKIKFFDKISKSLSPEGLLQNFLGQAKIVDLGNGEYEIIDTYDFNDKGKSFGVIDDTKKRGLSSYSLPRAIGRNYGSQDNYGAPVKIKIKLKEGGMLPDLMEMAAGGQFLTVGGEYHRIYKNADGDIMVNHPKEDKGKWDTINLTDKAGAKTVADGVAATKKWHRENPYAFGGNVILEKYQQGGNTWEIVPDTEWEII